MIEVYGLPAPGTTSSENTALAAKALHLHQGLVTRHETHVEVEHVDSASR